MRKEITSEVDEWVGTSIGFTPLLGLLLVSTIMVSCLGDDDISLQNGLSESVFALVQSVYRYSSQ